MTFPKTNQSNSYQKPKPYTIYKANRNNNGSAVQFDFNSGKGCVFIDCANQKNDERFDWENKLTVKLSPADISKIITVLKGKTQNIKLFHQPSKGAYKSSENVKNNVVELSSSGTGYYLRVSRQTLDSVKAVNITISHSESIILCILLEKAIEQIYAW